MFGETKEEIAQKFEQIQKQLDSGLAVVDSRIEVGFDRVDNRFDHLERRISLEIRRDEVPALERLLRPLEFVTELAKYGARFVHGTREWLFKEIQCWQEGKSRLDRCRVLLGDPGFGKTAIVAELCQRLHKSVIAVHLCRHDDGEKRDPRRMIQSLAYQVAQARPEYRKELERDLSNLKKPLDDEDVDTLFHLLFIKPLSKLHAPKTRGLSLIVIDALDEAEHDLKNEMLTVIARKFVKLPEWIGRATHTTRSLPNDW